MATTEISLKDIKITFGFKNILDGFNLELKSGERIGLVGPNGSGKTTIFKLILGIEKPTSGIISIRKGAKIGVLTQIPKEYQEGTKVKEVIYESLASFFTLEKKLRELEEKLKEPREDLDQILSKYGKLQEEFINLGGYEIETKISKVLTGFKIKEEFLEKDYNKLSGGEKTLINLAALMLQEPEILLLDEPTNHLDIETLEWLEQYLKDYSGSMIISSHDRYFLDNVINKTIEIDRGKAEEFHGNYTYYIKEKERRIMAEFEGYKNQQKQIAAMKSAIKRLQEWGKLAYPAGVGFFKRAASIQKRLEKLELIDKPQTKKDIPLSFNIENRSGKDVLFIEDLDLNIENLLLLIGANLSLVYGDKACLIGKNGSGKSTLIKAILGKITPENGVIKIGTNISLGYIPQEIIYENKEESVLEYIRKSFYGTETHLRSTLAKFMFYGDDVFKRVNNLSGGEKVRLKMLELMLQNPNFIILDEPTNHIDIDTREVLETALKDYKGTILFISHDRYFINKLSNIIFEIKNYKLNKYLGNYNDYKRGNKNEK